MKKIKLLVYSPTRIDNDRGAEKALLNFGKNINQQLEVSYYSLFNRGSGELNLRTIKEEYKLDLGEYPTYKENWVMRFFDLLDLIRRSDIIYFCNLYLKDELVVIFLSKLFKKRIYTVYQSSFSYPKSFLRNLSNELIKRRLIRFYDGVQLLNEAEINFFKDNKAKRIALIPNGVDSSITKPYGFRDLKNKQFALLFVGRLEDQKGIIYLLRVISKLQEIIPNKFIFNIVGNGKYEQEVTNLSKKSKNIIFHGPKSGEELYQIFSKSDCFIMTSIFEGSPLTLFEANLFYLPFVAFDIPGVHEYCRDGINGFTVPPVDVNFMVNKIVNLSNLFYHDFDKFKKMAFKSHEIAKKYDWKIISERIYKFISQND